MAWWNADDVMADLNAGAFGLPDSMDMRRGLRNVCDGHRCLIEGPHERDDYCPRPDRAAFPKESR